MDPSEPKSDRVCPRTGRVIEADRRARWSSLLLALAGLGALAWFLVRVLPKPSRAAYPCQRVAFPMATSFVLWILGLFGVTVAVREAGASLRRARWALAAVCAAAGAAAAIWMTDLPLDPAPAAWTPSDPPNAPLGVARGIHPGRVVWAHDPEATSWDGTSDYWWSDRFVDQAAVDRMLSRCVRRLAGEETDGEAWTALFRYSNRTRGRGDRGYRAGDGIAVKINMNRAPEYMATNDPIASPQTVLALLRQLVRSAGVPEQDITVYDAARCMTDAIYTPSHGEFPLVEFVDNEGAPGRTKPARDETVRVHYADARVGARDTSRLPVHVTEAAYLINLALLRGHVIGGVTLCAKNHFGSIWQPDLATDDGWKPSNLHVTIDKNANPMGSVNSLVDLMGHEHLGGKTVLYLIDGLYAAMNERRGVPVRWSSPPFGGDWTSSIFASQDGVAIDSVAVDFLRNEPALAEVVLGQSVDNYLHEAALADSPSSGAFYDPEGDGTRLGSLGAHEHWNSAAGKRYSRNLGMGDGIELVAADEGSPFLRGDASSDGALDISDPLFVLLHLFAGGGAPACVKAADTDDSGTIDMADAIGILLHLFAGRGAPPSPFGACGLDPTPDALSCESFGPCGDEGR